MSRKTIGLAVLGAAALVAIGARAETYTWANVASGLWSDTTKWTPTPPVGGPGAEDTARIDQATSITLTDDTAVKYMGNKYANVAAALTLDLADHTMTLPANQTIDGTVAMALDKSLPAATLYLKDGSADATKGLVFALNQAGWKVGGLSLDNVVMTGGLAGEHWRMTGRFVMKNGSVWRPDGNIQTGAVDARWNSGVLTPILSRRSFLSAEGTGTRIEAGAYQFSLRRPECRLYVEDGADVAWKDVLVGSSTYATNCAVLVDNGTLALTNSLQLGSATAGGCGAMLQVKGVNGFVTIPEEGGRLIVHEDTGVIFDFEVPAAGFARTPLVATAVETVARDASLPTWGATTNRVTCYAWCKAHPSQTTTLVSLTTANADFLQSLCDRTVFMDFPADLVAACKIPTMSVSADGKSLQLTAPEVNYAPVFSLSVSKGDANEQKRLDMTLADYGYEATKAVSIVCTWDYADTPSGETVTNLATDVSAALPANLSWQVLGLARERTPVRLTVTVSNDTGYEKALSVDFTTDGYVHKYYWNRDDVGYYADTDNWLIDKTTVPQRPPEEEDTILLKPGWVEHVIALDRDAACAGMNDTIQANEDCLKRAYGFDLGGHSLRVTGSLHTYICGDSRASGRDFSLNGVWLRLSNGSYVKEQGGIYLTWNGQTGASSVWLSDHAAATFGFAAFNGDGRFLIEGGSVWTNTANLRMETERWTAIPVGGDRYAFLCVTGACSAVHSPNNDIVTGGQCSDLYVLDGASLTCANLTIGGTNRSTNDHARVWNGTVVVNGNLQIGSTSTDLCNGKCPGWAAGYGSQLTLAGRDALVTVLGDGKKLALCEKTSAELVFDVPSTGYCAANGAMRAPLQATELELTARPADQPRDFEDTKLLVSAKAWMKANPDAKQELIRLTTSNAAALETLKSRVTLTTFRPAEAGFEYVTISDDGTALVLNAPPKRGIAIIVR